MELINSETHDAGHAKIVLVADSNERNRKFLTTFLKRIEYVPYEARAAQEALEVVTQVSPVLIVTGRKLDAGNDALSLMRSFRTDNPSNRTPWLVILSKSDPPAYERECLSAGALTCLRAPVTFENFYRVIQVAVEPIPRMTIRLSTQLPAAIDGKRSGECVSEISENGAHLLTRSLLPRDAKLKVQIKLPDSVVSADAVVIYAKRSDEDAKGRTGMGLQFLRIAETDQHSIRLFIRREMLKGIGPLPTAG